MIENETEMFGFYWFGEGIYQNNYMSFLVQLTNKMKKKKNY